MSLCYGDVLEGPGLGFEVHYHELPVTQQLRLAAGPLSYDIVPMEHHPTSIGYRFHVGGRTLAVSGDTRWCEALERLAVGSDLLVLECSSLDEHPHAHVSLAELRRRIGGLDGCEVLLVHLPDEVAVALAANPIACVSAGHDGLLRPI